MTRFLSARLSSLTFMVSACLLVAAPVSAQHMMGQGYMHGAESSCHYPSMRQVGKHLAKLKVHLHLTSSQLPAWDAFSKTMGTPPDMKWGMHDAMSMHQLSTPERLEKMTALHDAFIEEMQSQMKQRRETVRNFYNQLSVEQQQLFDEQFMSFHPYRR